MNDYLKASATDGFVLVYTGLVLFFSGFELYEITIGTILVCVLQHIVDATGRHEPKCDSYGGLAFGMPQPLLILSI